MTRAGSDGGALPLQADAPSRRRFCTALNRTRLARAALRARMPIICQERSFVEAGALMSYAADRKAVLARVAYFIDRILKGAKPADLPVEQAAKFELVINRRTAGLLGSAAIGCSQSRRRDWMTHPARRVDAERTACTVHCHDRQARSRAAGLRQPGVVMSPSLRSR